MATPSPTPDWATIGYTAGLPSHAEHLAAMERRAQERARDAVARRAAGQALSGRTLRGQPE
jgi:hypothetical protein